MPSNSSLKRAAEDMKYLLDRKYSRKTALNLVVNHYKLDAQERNFLGRYVFSEKDIIVHRSKLMPPDRMKGKDIVVDTYNVLIISETILSGGQIVEGMDGFIRDTQAVFSKYDYGEETKKALEALLAILSGYGPRHILFILDSQISRSGELAAYIRKELSTHSLKGDARTAKTADHDIKKLGRITLTSDSAIIEKVGKVIDIARDVALLSEGVFKSPQS